MLTKRITVEKIATLTGHRDCVYTVEQAQDPSCFFSAGGDGLVVRWDTRQPDTGELIAKIPASVYAIKFLPSLNQLWVNQNFEGIHVIDLETKKEVKSLKLTAASIFDIQVWQQSAFIGTSDGTLIVVDIPHFSVRKYIKASDKSVRSIAINPVNGEVAVGYSDFCIRVFDLHDFRLKYTVEAHTNSVFSVVYSPDYRYLLSGSRDAHLKIWAVEQEYSLHQSIVAHLYAINHIAFRADGVYFATGSMDKSIKIWDAQLFKLVKVIDRARHASHGTSVNKLLWLKNPYQLISASDDRTLSCWNLSPVSGNM